MATRLSDKREQTILAAYADWDPDAEGAPSFAQLAKKLRVSRPTLYAVIDRHGVERKRRTTEKEKIGGMGQDQLGDRAAFASAAARMLILEHHEAVAKNQVLRLIQQLHEGTLRRLKQEVGLSDARWRKVVTDAEASVMADLRSELSRPEIQALRDDPEVAAFLARFTQ